MAEAGKAEGESLDELIEKALDSQEPLKKPQAEKLKPQGLLERIVLSGWTAPAYAAAYAALTTSVLNLVGPELSLADKVSYFVAAPLLGYFSAAMFRQDWLFRKAEARYRKFRSGISKVFTALFDHPEITAIPPAAVLTGLYASLPASGLPFSEILKHPNLINLNLQVSAYLGLLYLSANYASASLALSRVLHPEAIKTVKKAASATINAYKARYEEAAQDLAELLETPKSYQAGVLLQTAMADMQMLSGNRSAVETYISALATEKTNYEGRNEVFLSIFLSAISRIATKVKKPVWAEEDDVKSLILAAKELAGGFVASPHLKKADEILLSAVRRNQKSRVAHMARASFLRATGQNRTADLEMKVCGELVMQDPNAKLEPVEDPSRNPVYFSDNVAAKQNEDPTPLEGERSIVEMFRKRFGSSAIYPMPVYRRGDSYVLLSERGPETLLDLIKKRKAGLEDFVRASELMAQMQKFGLERYHAGELSLDDPIRRIKQSDTKTLYFARRRLQATENIEQFNGVKMPQSYKDALGFDLAFVDLELANSQLLTMYKDSGPKNILKRPFGLMQFLDFEPQSLRLLPPQMDFINLTESVPYLSQEQLFWLQNVHFRLQERANKTKLDRQKFARTQAFSGFQWHDERLIYSTREAHYAKTEEEREERKKDQVWHLIRARECLDEIIEKGYCTGDQLTAALRASEELKRPIFPDPEEQSRLERLVNEERKKSLEEKPQSAGAGAIAAALVGIPVVLFASVFGAVSFRNNFVPIAGVPIIRQGERVLLAVQQETASQKQGESGLEYHVIEVATDKISFLTAANNEGKASLSEFSDKAVFLKRGQITLYDFIKGEFRTAQNSNLTNPEILPDGFWIVAEEKTQGESKYTSRLRRIRSGDMKDFALVSHASAVILNNKQIFSPDSRYLALFHGDKDAQATANSLSADILVIDMLEMKPFRGPWVSKHKKPTAAWSGNKTLAYTSEDGSEIYLSEFSLERHLPDSNPWQGPKIYEAGKQMPEGYEEETIERLKFIGNNHLAFVSRFSSTARQQVKLAASILDLKSGKIVSLDGSTLLDASGSRVLYVCNVPSDLCELDTKTGLSRNLTNTPNLAETLAVYAQGGKKVYAVTHPAGGNIGTSVPSLVVLDLVNGNFKVLKKGEDATLSYSLIAPPRRD